MLLDNDSYPIDSIGLFGDVCYMTDNFPCKVKVDVAEAIKNAVPAN